MKEKKFLKIQNVQQTFGPERKDWNTLPWHTLEEQVQRIQKRIYQASQQSNRQTVYRLQQELMGLEAARLLAVRHVTQDNQGKDTAGIDGIKSLTPEARLTMASTIHPDNWSHQPPRPIRRVWVPKAGTTEQRPLAILSMIDRCKQALVKLALEPEWEAKFESHSYGFRPGLGTRDAIATILLAIEHRSVFVFEADIEAAFDNINQTVVLDRLQTYPVLKQTINAWLKCGVMDGKTYIPTETGIPQGGVLSPLLLNVALHGMETAITESDANKPAAERPLLVRYADDIILLHSNLSELQKAVKRVTQWLATRGLKLHPQKTRITHTLLPVQGSVGFDFLSFAVRQVPISATPSEKKGKGNIPSFQTLVTPSEEARKRHLTSIGQRLLQLQSASQSQVIKELNPLIIGWASYYKEFVSSVTLSQYDDLLWHMLMNWASQRHPQQEQRWLLNRYWQHMGQQKWVFATPEGVQLRAYNQQPIVPLSEKKMEKIDK